MIDSLIGARWHGNIRRKRFGTRDADRRSQEMMRLATAPSGGPAADGTMICAPESPGDMLIETAPEQAQQARHACWHSVQRLGASCRLA